MFQFFRDNQNCAQLKYSLYVGLTWFNLADMCQGVLSLSNDKEEMMICQFRVMNDKL